MSGASDYLETQVLNWIKGTNFPLAPAAVYVALFNGDPTDTGTGGTEVTTTIRPAGRVAASFGANSGTGNGPTSIANDAIVDFGAAAGGASLTHFALYDAQSGGNLLVSSSLTTPLSPTAGTNVQFPVDGLSITVD